MNGLTKKLFLTAVLVTFGFACTYTWTGSPRNIEPREVCDPAGTFPQMVKIPTTTGAWQVVYACDQYPREAVAIAISMFYMEWRLTFGDPEGKIWQALNGIMIDWNPKSKQGNAYDVTGIYIQGASYGGLALSSSYVWVKPNSNEIVCESSLVHELVHIAIWTLKGTDGDPDHMGKKYSGWSVDHSALIQRVNQDLCTLGI